MKHQQATPKLCASLIDFDQHSTHHKISTILKTISTMDAASIDSFSKKRSIKATELWF